MNKRKDLISSLVLIAFGAAWVLHGLQYSMGALALPGPGLVPMIAGVVLILLSLQLLLSALPSVLRTAGDSSVAVPAAGKPHNHIKAVLMLAAMVVYVVTIGWTGYLLNTFLLVLLGARIIGARDWSVPLLVAVGTSAITFVLFMSFLNVPLPQGEWIPITFGER